jgi:hypothetical protein
MRLGGCWLGTHCTIFQKSELLHSITLPVWLNLQSLCYNRAGVLGCSTVAYGELCIPIYIINQPVKLEFAAYKSATL